MDSILSIVSMFFDFFVENTLFDVPIIVYLVGFTVFALVLGFVKGDK